MGSKGTIQFTPNFCPVSEYAEAFRAGATVVVDNVDILRLYPEIFQGKSVGLRIDPHAHAVEENLKHGHHSHVPLAFAPTTNTFKPKKLAVSSNLNNKEKGENSVNRVKYMYDTVSQKKEIHSNLV